MPKPVIEIAADVIVVGAGIIGLAVAERMLMLGAKVTVLERSLTGRESSWAGGGILAPLYPWNYADEVIRLADRSARQFPVWTGNLLRETGIDPEYEQSGLLMLPTYDEAAALHWCAMQAVPVEQRTMAGFLGDGTQVSGQALFFPGIAQVRNPKLLQALQRRIMQLGGRIIENCAISGFKTANGYIQSVQSACGEFRADHYIVCAGAWSKAVLGEHTLLSDIKPVKGQMLLFKYDVPPISAIFVQNDVYLIPRRDGHLLVGSTLEKTGFDKQPTQAAYDYLFSCAQAMLPSLGRKSAIQHWAGLRPGSPHNIPTIGQHPEILNLWINSGHFRYGVTMAPTSAEILANEITRIPQPFDISPYRPK